MDTSNFTNSVTGGESTITSANATVMVTVKGLLNTPYQLEGWSVDKAWDTAAVVVTESKIGVDGRKTAGLVYNPIKQTFSFLADSPSVKFFEFVNSKQRSNGDVYYISATVTINATGQSYTCNKGTLEDYNSVASAGKVLGDREFSISWGSITSSVV